MSSPSAAPAEASRALLQGITGSGLQQYALNGIEFYDSRLVLHTGPVFATATPAFRSFLNCRVTGDYCPFPAYAPDAIDYFRPAPAGRTARFRRLWFAGGYTLPYDSQETALLSAINVAWKSTFGLRGRRFALRVRKDIMFIRHSTPISSGAGGRYVPAPVGLLPLEVGQPHPTSV